MNIDTPHQSLVHAEAPAIHSEDFFISFAMAVVAVAAIYLAVAWFVAMAS